MIAESRTIATVAFFGFGDRWNWRVVLRSAVFSHLDTTNSCAALEDIKMMK